MNELSAVEEKILTLIKKRCHTKEDKDLAFAVMISIDKCEDVDRFVEYLEANHAASLNEIMRYFIELTPSITVQN